MKIVRSAVSSYFFRVKCEQERNQMRTSWRFTHHRDMKNSAQHTKWRYKRRNGKSSHCDIQSHCIAGSYSLNGYPFFNFARVIFFVSIWFSKFICADVLFVCLSVWFFGAEPTVWLFTFCMSFFLLFESQFYHLHLVYFLPGFFEHTHIHTHAYDTGIM